MALTEMIQECTVAGRRVISKFLMHHGILKKVTLGQEVTTGCVTSYAWRMVLPKGGLRLQKIHIDFTRTWTPSWGMCKQYAQCHIFLLIARQQIQGAPGSFSGTPGQKWNLQTSASDDGVKIELRPV